MSCLLRSCIVCLLVSLSPGLAQVLAPKIVRVYPLGGQRGTSVELEILGEFLANAKSVEFDCRDLVWMKTTSSTSSNVTGTVSISPHASLGPHLMRVATLDGPSTSAIFNVDQFPSTLEVEPNDLASQAQTIQALPASIQGRLDGAIDIDQFVIRARAGERWTFDLRSIEYGSALEASMELLDGSAKRVAFDDDRNDFDETPFIDHTFARDGAYVVKLDQYRGPRGFNFGKNCGYILRITQLPRIEYASPLGLRVGRSTKVRLRGKALGDLEKVFLTELRQAEFARMTYPHTVPIPFRADPPAAADVARVDGKILNRGRDAVDVAFDLPSRTRAGLWSLSGADSKGAIDGFIVEISDIEEYDEQSAGRADWRKGAFAINGSLGRPGEEDVYAIDATAGRPLHFSTLAAQLGGPHIDTVLVLRDAEGNKLAEDDDIVAGQGTLIGNLDSSLFFTPERDGPLFISVRDRVGRGGSTYQYRLKVASEMPSFQLFTTPENFIVPRGDSAEIKVHLVREKGFAGEVSVWVEGMPPGLEAPRGKFRADQLFEPNADGADMIIPELHFRIQVPPAFPLGDYPLRILGTATAEESSPKRQVVQAHNTLIMGPLLDSWNFIRRPLPQVVMTVCEPPPALLESMAGNLTLRRGESTTLELKSDRLAPDAAIRLVNLPAGVSQRLSGRHDNQWTLMLEASLEAALGSFDISAETDVDHRRVSTRSISLSIEPVSKSYKQGVK